jgi:hypothetical protein
LQFLYFVVEGDAEHGLKVLLIAFLTEKCSRFIFELPLTYEAFLAGMTSADPAPVLVGGKLFVATRAETAVFLFFFDSFRSAVEYLEHDLGLGE